MDKLDCRGSGWRYDVFNCANSQSMMSTETDIHYHVNVCYKEERKRHWNIKFTWIRVRRLASALWCDGLLCRGIFIFCTLPPSAARAPFWASSLLLASNVPAVSGDGELLRERECAWRKHSGDRLRPRLFVAGLAVTGTTPEDAEPAVDGISKRSSRNEKSVYRSGVGGRPWMAVPRSNCESVERPFNGNWLCSSSSKVCCWCEEEWIDGRRLTGWLSDIHLRVSVLAQTT